MLFTRCRPVGGVSVAAAPFCTHLSEHTLNITLPLLPHAAGLKVIVIGGGVAGLKAAGDLQRGGAEVVVLEARDRCAGMSQAP